MYWCQSSCIIRLAFCNIYFIDFCEGNLYGNKYKNIFTQPILYRIFWNVQYTCTLHSPYGFSVSQPPLQFLNWVSFTHQIIFIVNWINRSSFSLFLLLSGYKTNQLLKQICSVCEQCLVKIFLLKSPSYSKKNSNFTF